MEGTIGIVVGAVLSWALTHYYYRKQLREQINPLPQITELSHAVHEVLDVAEIRNDKELEAKMKRLVVALTQSRVRVLNMISTTRLFLHLLISEHEKGTVVDFLNEKGGDIAKTVMEKLQSVNSEYEDVTTLADQQVGKNRSKRLQRKPNSKPICGGTHPP